MTSEPEYVTAQARLVAQMVKNMPEMQEAWPPSPGQEDPLEKRMATLSSIIAWRVPQRSLTDYSLWSPKELCMTDRLTHTHAHCRIIKRLNVSALNTDIHRTSKNPHAHCPFLPSV